MATNSAKLLTTDDVRKLLSQSCDLVGQKQLAADIGVSAQYICDVMKGRREPGEGICSGLGLERVVYYRRKKG